MTRRQVALIVATAGAVILLMVVLLATGGGDVPSESADAAGDVAVQGGTTEADLDIADVRSVEVREVEGGLELVAEFVGQLPQSLKNKSLEMRWDLSVEGTPTWIIAANLDAALSASVLGQQQNYTSSTIDGTMPGSVNIEGSIVTLTVRTEKLPKFPDAFEWQFGTTYDLDRTDEESPIARDTAPNEGTRPYPPA